MRPLRSSISRAYFAAFGTARQAARGEGLHDRTAAVHGRLWAHYGAHRSERRRTVGVEGLRLRRSRNMADYDVDRAPLPSDAQAALDQARLILEILGDRDPTR